MTRKLWMLWIGLVAAGSGCSTTKLDLVGGGTATVVFTDVEHPENTVTWQLVGATHPELTDALDSPYNDTCVSHYAGVEADESNQLGRVLLCWEGVEPVATGAPICGPRGSMATPFFLRLDDEGANVGMREPERYDWWITTSDTTFAYPAPMRGDFRGTLDRELLCGDVAYAGDVRVEAHWDFDPAVVYTHELPLGGWGS